jgi:transposase
MGVLQPRAEVMSSKRRRYPPEFKAKVVLEALRADVSISDLAEKYDVHQTMIFVWRRQVVEGLPAFFSKKHENRSSELSEMKRLHAKIGELVVERDTLAKGSRRS